MASFHSINRGLPVCDGSKDWSLCSPLSRSDKGTPPVNFPVPFSRDDTKSAVPFRADRNKSQSAVSIKADNRNSSANNGKYRLATREVRRNFSIACKERFIPGSEVKRHQCPKFTLGVQNGGRKTSAKDLRSAVLVSEANKRSSSAAFKDTTDGRRTTVPSRSNDWNATVPITVDDKKSTVPVTKVDSNFATSGRATEEVRKVLCIYCKEKGFPPGPEYIFHITVCAAAKRPKFTLEFIKGDIMNEAFRGCTTIIAQVVDCVGIKPLGVSKVLADKYPFSNTYSSRRRIVLNRAFHEDRERPGTISICKSTTSHDPIIVNMFAQFCAGKSFDQNVWSQEIVSRASRNGCRNGLKMSTSNDSHFLEGLLKDTLSNRITWFQTCLEKLEKVVSIYRVQKIVFPYIIDSTLSLSDWEKFYIPAIRSFFDVVSQCEVNVVVLDIEQKKK